MDCLFCLDLNVNLIVERVGSGLGEIPGTDSALEEGIDLSVSSVLWFGEAEVGPDHAKETKATPKETGLSPPVPSSRVEHVRDDHAVDDAEDVVQVSRQDHSLDTEPRRWELSNKRVTYGPDGRIIEECVHQ